jgi:hypothetical protein
VERILRRAREQFEQSLSVYAVATHSRRDCPELALLLPDIGAAIGCTLRGPLYLHVDSCPDCVVLRPGPVDAEGLLAAGVLPAAPREVRSRVTAVPVPAAGAGPGRARRPRVPIAVGCAVAASLVVGLVVLARPGGHADAPIALSTPQEAPDRPVSVLPSRWPGGEETSRPPAAEAVPPTTGAPSTAPPATRRAEPRTAPTRAVEPAPTASAVRSPGVRPRTMADAGGTLAWSASTVDLGRGSGPRTVRLTAPGEAVAWSLDVSQNDWITVTPRAGTLRAGQSISITISANTDRAPAATWKVTVSARPGGESLVIRGDGRRVTVR